MHKFLRWVRVSALVWLVSAAPAATPRPKLVLAIVVDQFRYDYLTRFRSEYHAGFERLLTRGAVFTNARFEHFPTVTAIGHSTFMTGATPSMSGIVGNEWYDRTAGKTVTSVSDEAVQLLGASGAGSSPARLLVSTLGDELKMAHSDSKVIGISFKDRSAILPAGHMADSAYWIDARSGNFVSSTFYFAQLPGWVKDFNDSHPAESFRGAHWLNHVIPAEGGDLTGAVDASPFGNELLEKFAERAIQAERLGQRDATDLLTLSFSSNDMVGHAKGPDSPEVKAISIETDQVLGKLFGFLESKVGMANILVVMTGDHGVAPIPEVSAAHKMPGGRMPHAIVQNTVQAALTAKFGEGQWILSPSEFAMYFNQDLIRQKKLDPAEVNRVASDAAGQIPHVFRTYTREQLASGMAMEDYVGRRVMNGFYGPRSADLYVLVEPYWIFSSSGTTHGTTFSYDAHVPLIFMGPGIRTGRFDNQVAINDVAPTVATYLDIETPSGSVGRCLGEILTN